MANEDILCQKWVGDSVADVMNVLCATVLKGRAPPRTENVSHSFREKQ